MRRAPWPRVAVRFRPAVRWAARANVGRSREAWVPVRLRISATRPGYRSLDQRVDGLAIQPLDDRREQLDGLVEVTLVDDADMAVDVAGGHAHRQARHAFGI